DFESAAGAGRRVRDGDRRDHEIRERDWERGGRGPAVVRFVGLRNAVEIVSATQHVVRSHGYRRWDRHADIVVDALSRSQGRYRSRSAEQDVAAILALVLREIVAVFEGAGRDGPLVLDGIGDLEGAAGRNRCRRYGERGDDQIRKGYPNGCRRRP